MNRLVTSSLVLVFAAVFAVTSVSAQKGSAPSNGIYMIRMSGDPAVSYKGGVPGYKSTAPAAGRKIDPLAPDTIAYVGYLKNQHDRALAKVAGNSKL